MKNLYIIFLLMIHVCNAQKFVAPIYFENNIGERDTIWVGGEDSSYTGVTDINGTSYKNFDVRLTNTFCGYTFGSNKFETKYQVSLDAMMVQIKSKDFPITIRWDSSMFHNRYRQSWIGSWLVGGDIACNPSSIVVLMGDSSKLIFAQNDLYEISSDTNFYQIFIGITDTILTGIKKSIKPNISLFPNPVTTYIQIQNLTSNAVVKIHNALGKCIYDERFANDEINCSLWPSGIYYLTLIDQGEIIKRKIVIEK